MSNKVEDLDKGEKREKGEDFDPDEHQFQGEIS